jgi:MFS family permease
MYWWMPETLRRTPAKQGSGVSTFTALFGERKAVTTLLLWLTFLPRLLILYRSLNWLPTLAVSVGLDAAVTPRAALVFKFASVVGALLFGRIVDRRGARWPLGLAYAALIVVLLGLAYARDELNPRVQRRRRLLPHGGELFAVRRGRLLLSHAHPRHGLRREHRGGPYRLCESGRCSAACC